MSDYATFDVYQDGQRVASAYGPRESAMREAAHYASVYGQDGPVKVRERRARRTSEKYRR